MTCIFPETATKLISAMVAYTPSTEFLSDIITVEAAILGILIPLSFEIVSRFSDRYKSRAATDEIQRRLKTKWLIWLTATGLVLSITLRFFQLDVLCDLVWRTLAQVSALLLFVILVLTVIDLITIYHLHVDQDSILEGLLRDIEKHVKKK